MNATATTKTPTKRGRLLLSRRIGESILIGETLVTLTSSRGDRSVLMIEAPKDVQIMRTELHPGELKSA